MDEEFKKVEGLLGNFPDLKRYIDLSIQKMFF